jgi:hypothetical protein
MKVIATANLRFFVPAICLLIALTVGALISSNDWSVTLAYHLLGPLTAPLFYFIMLAGLAFNLNIVIQRRRYIYTDGRFLQIRGYRPIPIDQIKAVEIVKDWRGVWKLAIAHQSATSFVTSFKFNESLQDVQQAISLLLRTAPAYDAGANGI